MTEYSNVNRGCFWRNDKKLTESHPDWKGSINVEGVDYWLSAWNRKPDANPKAPSVSISIQKKEVQQQPSGTGGGQYSQPDNGFTQNPEPAAKSGQYGAPTEDDIPFMSPYKHREYLI